MVARLLAMLLLFPWYAAEIPEAFVLALAALEEVIDTLAVGILTPLNGRSI